MPHVQSTLGDQHVTSGAPWVGEVSLLQNYHSIPDMPVKKMYLHRHTCHCSSRITLNRAVPQSSCGREGHPVRPRFLSRGRVYLTLYPLCCLPMLRPHVPCHQPKRHILPLLLTLHPYLLPLPVGRALSCHPSPVLHL